MPDLPFPSVSKLINRGALRIAGIYLLIGIFWILFSDQLAEGITSNPVILTRISIAKGWIFILVTALLLYGLIRREAGILEQAQSDREQLLVENQRQKALLDAIFEADPSGLAVVGADLRFVYNNPAYRYVTPDPHLDPIGQTYPSVWATEEGNFFQAEVEEALRSGKPFLSDGIQRPSSDGSKCYFTFQVRRIDWDKQPAALLILWDITERKRFEMALVHTHTQLEQSYEATLQGWVRALELHQRETADHSRRVVELTMQMARALGIEEEHLIHIQRGALLHDIGKLGVPDSILLKPTSLTPEEWVIMRQHPEYAYQLLNDIPYLRPAIDIPYCHHERWDGSGYPLGIHGEAIPLPARIFSVVDVQDALLSDRPYRQAWKKADVWKYLVEQKGKRFDPNMVDLLLQIDHSQF